MVKSKKSFPSRAHGAHHVSGRQLHHLHQWDVGADHTQQDAMGQLERHSHVNISLFKLISINVTPYASFSDRFLLLAEHRHGHRRHQQQTLSFGGEELKNIQHTHTLIDLLIKNTHFQT